jgi:hypothetical protein
MLFCRKRLLVLAFMAMPISAHAAPACEQFKAVIMEGTNIYKLRPATFRVEKGGNSEAWHVTGIFPDVRAAILCRNGQVRSYMADADDDKPASALHVQILATLGLQGYQMDMRSALALRDQLVSEAKEAEPHTAKRAINGGTASFVISFAGVPSFQIETKEVPPLN